jgi:hypothetical protein
MVFLISRRYNLTVHAQDFLVDNYFSLPILEAFSKIDGMASSMMNLISS